MNLFSLSTLLAMLTLAAAGVFLAHAVVAFRHPTLAEQAARAKGKSRAIDPPKKLRFAGTCHPMTRQDKWAAVILTAVYALTGFFQLGDLTAPTHTCDFAQGQSVTVRVEGDAVYTAGLRHYSGLGTGGYNVEVSSDGETWSTLWQRKDDPNDPGRVTGYYFAQAEGYDPSYALEQGYNDIFKWADVVVENPQNVRYLRISGNPDGQVLELAKLCLLDGENNAVPFDFTVLNGDVPAVSHILTVDDAVPDGQSWHNSAYFDEIYHARTAKEHIDNVYPYEITHPPLGKLIIGLGIRLFGMTPFGWRFMGVLFGTMMLPILYIFLQNLFGKTPVSVCGTILLATDFMHLTHTRIATIDTYAVFFILAMYFFMYRYLTLPAGTPFKKGLLPLFLSALMWSLGAASKWTVLYAVVGLAILYFMGFYQKLRDWPAGQEGEKTRWMVTTLLVSTLLFAVMPVVIYTLSYLPYAFASHTDLSPINTLTGLGRSFPVLWSNVTAKLSGAAAQPDWSAGYIPTDSLGGIMLSNQWYMLTYHQGVHQSHPYSAWWFQWIADLRPILYYMDNFTVDGVGYTTRFAAFSNPVLCWGGLGSIILCACHCFRKLWSKAAALGGLGLFCAIVTYNVQHTENGVFDPNLSQDVRLGNGVMLVVCVLAFLALAAALLYLAPGYDGRAVFLVIGYLSQLVPWMFVGRTTFAYHYFPSTVFLVLAMCYLFSAIIDRSRDWKPTVYGLTGLSVALYAMFYPVLIGLTIPNWYEPIVRWLESWPL